MNRSDLVGGRTAGLSCGIRLIHGTVGRGRLVLASGLGTGTLFFDSQFRLDRLPTGGISTLHGILKLCGTAVVVATIEFKFDMCAGTEAALVRQANFFTEPDVYFYRHNSPFVW